MIGRMAVAACCLTVVSSVDAQTLTPSEPRPVPGLFGRTQLRDESLDVSVSTSSVYDNNLVGAQGAGITDPQTQGSGPYDDLTTRVTYTKKHQAMAFSIAEGSSVRYYPTLADLVSAKHSAAAGFSVQSARTAFSVNQSIDYAPFYSFTTLPQLFGSPLAEIHLPTSNDFIVRNEARILGSSASVTKEFGGRTSLLLSASTQNTDFLKDGSGLRTSTASGRLVYHMSRDIGLVVGYGYQEGRYRLTSTSSETTELHNIDVGVDYRHALSLTRRTTIGFTTGSTINRGVDRAANYRLVGDLHVNREIGRTWHAAAAYHRGVGLVDGFQQPLFADSLVFDVGGALSPRVSLMMHGGYSKGHLDGTNTVGGNENENGSARVRVALSRLLAISGEYVLYRYRFDQATALPAGMPLSLDRQGLRVGLDVWLPLLR